MRLSNLNKYFYLIPYLFIFTSYIHAEDSVDIWKKNNKKIEDQIISKDKKKNKSLIKLQDKKNSINITVEEELTLDDSVNKIYGIIDPEENNFTLNMWQNTDGKQIKDAFKRLNKLKLSNVAEEIFINTILTNSYLPKNNMTDEEFLELKMNWLIKNNKDDLLEEFLIKNSEFKNKKKIIQYLVDTNIAKTNLNDGCKKTNFISKETRDSYLEKFKIYCLIYNDKKTAANLLFDILKEQGLSDNFFNNKINYLLGFVDKPNNKIKDDNLLNFYLSSVTVPDFKYEPSDKTNKYIWEYLNAANLVKIDNVEDKEKIKNLELAANNNTLDKSKIFEIYKRISFDINNLINAEETYRSFDGIESRALIYQKYLLSDNVANKIELLLLLRDLFKKDDLSNVYTEFLSERLKNFSKEEIPDSYREVVTKNIIMIEKIKSGRIKYDDKILHRSKVLRFYTEKNTSKQKTQSDLKNVYKKVKRNKNYFFSAKDLSLFESLKVDGLVIPKDLDLDTISKKYSIPEDLLKLAKNQETGLLALKFVEIIGQDDLFNLDAETIYFITHILNEARLIKFRNKVLTRALPLRA